MQDKLVYEYALIRLVPNVEREEFLNIGVILFCKSCNFIKARMELNELKIKNMSSTIDLIEIQRYVESFVTIAQGKNIDSPISKFEIPSRFRWLTAKRSTMLQTSSIHTGICYDLETTFDHIFLTMVK